MKVLDAVIGFGAGVIATLAGIGFGILMVDGCKMVYDIWQDSNWPARIVVLLLLAGGLVGGYVGYHS